MVCFCLLNLGIQEFHIKKIREYNIYIYKKYKDSLSILIIFVHMYILYYI